MKKYLLALIPFLGSILLSIAYLIKTPQGSSHPAYPYNSEAYLSYFASRWLYIGAIISAVLIACFLIDDLFNKAGKYINDKRYQKHLRAKDGT